MEKEVLIDLVQRSQNGDMEAFEKLLLHAHTSVSYQCRKMLKNEQDAEDMTQEVLVTVYQKLDTLKEPAAFHKWLHQITASRCINALTRTHVEFQIAEDEDGHSVLDTLEEVDEKKIPEKWLDTKETTRMIEEIVDSLPEVQRMCTLMFYYSELSVKEISRIMKVSENTIKSRLNYARKAIKEKVQEYEKKGIKLYGLSPLPFLYYFLHKCKDENNNPVGAKVMVDKIFAQSELVAAGVVNATGSAAAGSSGTAAATAAAGTAGAAATASGTTGLFGLSSLSIKVIAGITAALVTVGGITVAATMGDDSGQEQFVPTIIQETQDNSSGQEDIWIPKPEEETEETEGITAEETESSANADQHTHSYTSEVMDATCTEKGYTIYTCSCGDNYTSDETNATGHDYLMPDDTATCTESGIRTYTCATCGYTYGIEIPANGHKCTLTVVAPTCTEQGYTLRQCLYCDFSESIEYTDAIGHDYNEVVTAPTCVQYGEGYTTYTCMTCGYSYKDNYTPQLEHVQVYTGTKEPTCVQYGGDCYACINCDFTNIDNVVPPTGHSYTSVIIAPTETEQGYTEHTCTACGDSYRDSYTDALGAEE